MKKWTLPLTLLCFLLGILLVLVIKPQVLASQNNSNTRTEVLIQLITNLEAETSALETKLTNLRQDTEQLILQADIDEAETTKLQQQLLEEQLRAGLTPVEGPGIVVVLDDNRSGLNNAPSEDANRYVIHYDKLLSIVNDLRAAHAEAISINGQRIVASSEIRCVGNVILVNTTRLAPPFEISAIGDVNTLEDAITNSSSYELLRVSGFPVSYRVTTIADPTIQLPAYTGSLSTQHMHIIEEEEASA